MIISPRRLNIPDSRGRSGCATRLSPALPAPRRQRVGQPSQAQCNCGAGAFILKLYAPLAENPSLLQLHYAHVPSVVYRLRRRKAAEAKNLASLH